MKKKNGSPTDSLPHDLLIEKKDERNWNCYFDNVNTLPDEELEVCCWWEYARESYFVRQVQRRVQKQSRMEELSSKHPKVWERAITILDTYRMTCELPDNIRMIVTEPVFNQRFPAPWQSLSSQERKLRIPDPPPRKFLRGACEDAEIICRRGDLRSPRSNLILRFGPPSYAYGSGEPSSVITRYGEEIAVVRIPWRQYRNKEIAATFLPWLIANRPKDMPEPKAVKGPGKKTSDFRAKLQNLGIMRLLKSYSVAAMRTRCPETVSRFKDWESKHWSEHRTSAREHFRTLFPFEETPLSDRGPRRGGGHDK